MTDAILALNAGSSSIKFSLFAVNDSTALSLRAHGSTELVGKEQHFTAKDGAGKILSEERWTPKDDHFQPVLEQMIGWIESHLGADTLVAVGHRIVHGGQSYIEPQRVTPELVNALTQLIPLAPLHQPHSLAPIRALSALRPKLPQVACFDTAFHHTMPRVATRFALPRKYDEAGLRRYGFHGLSYEYLAQRLRELAPALAKGRVIAAHLGQGASLCAMSDGRSIDSTMGFSTLDGLMMGTRCGSLDPGAALYLQREYDLSPQKLEALFYKESGLLGVSGIAADMRTLLASQEPHAREAIELFVYRVAREIGALASSLGGLNGLVFSAGIGEHTAEIRSEICARLGWLGIALDQDANACHAQVISTPASPVEVRVIPTDEEAMIASHTRDLIANER